MLSVFSNPAQLRTEVLSGLTVALALVPEAIAFALVAQLHPLTGLYAAFIVALITSSIGGRPGMISAAAGSLAVVMVALVVTHGPEYLFAAVVLMGIFQLLAGLLRLGKFIRMVPHPVMLGFVNGLAIVIFLAQFSHFKTRLPDGTADWLPSGQIAVMVGLIALTMAIIYLLPRVLRAVPAALAAIVVVTLLVSFAGIDTRTVGDMASIAGGLPKFHLPSVPWNLETLRIVLPYSLVLAGVGLIESLLTLNLLDEITDTRGAPNRECLGLGAANVVAGFFSSMGGCALIGQSMINVGNGARLRLSGIVAALSLLAFILLGSRLIEAIPLAALIGLMFVVCEKTFEWSSFKLFGRAPRSDVAVGLLVAAVTVFADLAVAVIAGVIASALVFAWEHAKNVQAHIDLQADAKVYRLKGTLFFASTARFADLFSPRDDPATVIVDFAEARAMDHSAIAAIDALAQRYRALGKTLRLRHLSPDCAELLARAGSVVERDLASDPRYHVADDRLG